MSGKSRNYSESFCGISRQNTDLSCFLIPVYQNKCLKNHASLDFTNNPIVPILCWEEFAHFVGFPWNPQYSTKWNPMIFQFSIYNTKEILLPLSLISIGWLCLLTFMFPRWSWIFDGIFSLSRRSSCKNPILRSLRQGCRNFPTSSLQVLFSPVLNYPDQKPMSFIAGCTGCCIGLLTKLYSNALRKLPYMRGRLFHRGWIWRNHSRRALGTRYLHDCRWILLLLRKEVYCRNLWWRLLLIL